MQVRPFFDADEEFKRMHGITPADTITNLGEPKFRDMEAFVLAELGKLSGYVIATGGGAVTREENYPSLHQNGTIVYLKRDIDKLSTDGRPLSQNRSLAELFSKRKEAYERFADMTVENDRSPEETADNVIKALKKLDFSNSNHPKKEN